MSRASYPVHPVDVSSGVKRVRSCDPAVSTRFMTLLYGSSCCRIA